MKWWSYVLSFLVLTALPFAESLRAQVQPGSGHYSVSGATDAMEDSQRAHRAGSWEGLAQGGAYSEFNHRFVGFLVLVFGLAELGQALQCAWG